MKAAARTILALDYGDAYIGTAVALVGDMFATPLLTLANDDHLYANIAELIAQHGVTQLVVGWPRSLDGGRTSQSKKTEEFAQRLEQYAGLPVILQDEALTSQAAAEQLPKKMSHAEQKTHEHQLAAKIILEDFLATDRNA